MCECFVGNKLSIYYGEDKTKYILSSKEQNLPQLNITYNFNRVKQFYVEECLGSYLVANLSGESMGMKTFKKINRKLQFLYRQNSLLNPKLCILMCNSLIQPRFDYACISWCRLVSKKKKYWLLKTNVSVFA